MALFSVRATDSACILEKHIKIIDKDSKMGYKLPLWALASSLCFNQRATRLLLHTASERSSILALMFRNGGSLS